MNARIALPVLLTLMAAAACSDDANLTGPETAAPPGAGAPAPILPGVVQVQGGQVQGDVVGNARRYLTTPYAKPPIGELRWQPPQKPDAWTGLRHEAEFALACAQNMSAGSPASRNEDCLYLNVWQPNPPPTAAAVMVWIHGGGNFAGGTNDKVPTSEQLWFDGRVFAERHGIVVVTLNYRLGPLGFFAHPDLAAEGGNAGNQGLLDQNFALQWVRDNIAAFGGDPGNVTIFGESAGSSDVCYHVASPKSRGLFHRAISQSGGCTGGLGREVTPDRTEAAIQDFARLLGCEARAGQLACLRQKPIDEVMQNAMQPNPMAGDSGPGQFRFSIVVDGPNGMVPKTASLAFDAGELARVPYLLGSNSDEGTLFLLGTTGPMTEAEYRTELTNRYGAAADQLATMYAPSKYGGSARKALERVVGDAGLVCGTHDSARRAAKAGLTVFMYNFNLPWAVGGGSLGVAHAAEISHAFGVPYLPVPDANSQLVADEMNAYWARFAKTGDPNGAPSAATWPRFLPDAADSDQRLQIDPQWQVLANFRKDECALWRTLYAAGG